MKQLHKSNFDKAQLPHKDQNQYRVSDNQGFHKSTKLAMVALLPFVCSHTFAFSAFILIILYQ